MNITVQVLCGHMFSVLGFIPSSGIARLGGNFLFHSFEEPPTSVGSKKKQGNSKKKKKIYLLLHSVQFSHPVVSDSLRPHGLQHTRPPCPSPTPGVYPNSCSLSRWCYPEASGGGREEQPHPQGGAAAWVQEGWEELLHVQVQEGQLWGDTPRPR